MSQDNTTTSPAEELVEHTFNRKTLKVYPEIAEFFRVKADADRMLQLGYAKADAAYNAEKNTKYIAYLEGGGNPGEWDERREMGELYETRRRERREVEGKYYDLIEIGRIDPARRTNPDNPNVWADLRDKTTHKEVKWIMDNTVRSQPYESEIMLHYLPSSVEELWEYAKTDHQFCTVFDQFMTQAEAAGIFSEFTSQVGMKEFRALQSWMRRELYGSTATEITRRVSSIMKAMREDAEKRLIEAKAEWQGLDEAWRSERARRAAATRAANRAAQEALSEDIAEGEESIRTAGVFDDAGQFHPQTPESQPEAPKASAQDDFVLANSN